MLTVLAAILGIASMVGAYFAIHSKKLTVAIIATGIVGMIASILFLLLAAPDVAMTEASIGSALTTAIFFFTLNKIRQTNG
ncbi:MAG: hydrogenase subunit MbhD domain-containing protein [Bacteroidota bacterium]